MNRKGACQQRNPTGQLSRTFFSRLRTDGLLGFSIVALTVFVPGQLNPAKQRIAVYLWLAMLVVVFSLLMKLFKVKNGGYPFHLLF